MNQIIVTGGDNPLSAVSLLRLRSTDDGWQMAKVPPLRLLSTEQGWGLQLPPLRLSQQNEIWEVFSPRYFVYFTYIIHSYLMLSNYQGT